MKEDRITDTISSALPKEINSIYHTPTELKYDIASMQQFGLKKVEDFIAQKFIKADERNTEKIIEFILDNAVKFTKQGKVEFSLNRKSSEVYQLIIEDTGIGIADEYKDKIYEPFSQENMSATREYDGIGLSLALAYEYALVNNFKINFDSVKGKGTRFMLEFPAYDVAELD